MLLVGAATGEARTAAVENCNQGKTAVNRITCICLLALMNLTTPAVLSASPLGAPAADGVPVSRKVATPTGLTADAGDARVTLSWRPSEGATSYTVFRRTQATGETIRVAVGITALTFVDTDVVNGTVYRYWVRASSGAVTSPSSSEAAARPETLRTAETTLPSPTLTYAAPMPTAVPVAAPAATASSEAQSRAAEQASGLPAAPALPARSAQSAQSAKSETTEKATNPASQPAMAASAVMVAMPLVAQPEATAAAAAVEAMPAAATAPAALQPAAAPMVPQPKAQASAPASASMAAGAAMPAATTPAASTPSVPVAMAEPTTVARSTDTTVSAGGSTPPMSSGAAAAQTDPVTGPAPPSSPKNLTSTAGNGTITLSWSVVSGATSYNIYRSLVSNGQVVIGSAFTNSFPDSGLVNGTTYYYKVTAVSSGGESSRSSEVSNSPIGPPAPPDPATVAAFRLLRQGSWGPKPGEVDAVRNQGAAAWIASQLAMPPSTYPDTLFNMSVEDVQERFMANALTGQDQLRQRVAFALHKILVVSGVEITNSKAIVTYHRILLNGAFGNYKDLMRDITLNPAMGRYLTMLNNKSQAASGAPPNANFARELMQLFTIGIARRNPDGTPVIALSGAPVLNYLEKDVGELAKALSGWTFGDGNPTTVPNGQAAENWGVPMEPVARYHDTNAKNVANRIFPAGQTARQDFDQAMDFLFNHASLPPAISRQLIQQLVTSNPSPAYVADIARVFADNGVGVRGDLAAVVTAILLHPEAGVTTTTSGKLSEPVLFVLSQLRALNATVTDHPFIANKTEAMGQKVLFPPTVFSYFSPNYNVRQADAPGGALAGPEFQILTAVTTLERSNFVAALLGGWFGTDVVVDYTPFTSMATDSTGLVDYCSRLFMGGRMSPEARMEIINAVRVTPASNYTERARTALYLTLTAAQFQVDR